MTCHFLSKVPAPPYLVPSSLKGCSRMPACRAGVTGQDLREEHSPALVMSFTTAFSVASVAVPTSLWTTWIFLFSNLPFNN